MTDQPKAADTPNKWTNMIDRLPPNGVDIIVKNGMWKLAEPAADTGKAPLDAREWVRYERDLNSGAGLWAVFLGDMPLHHFRADTAKVEKYIKRIREQLTAFRDASLQSYRQRIAELEAEIAKRPKQK